MLILILCLDNFAKSLISIENTLRNEKNPHWTSKIIKGYSDCTRILQNTKATYWENEGKLNLRNRFNSR